jgi:hypothetical protein
MTDIYANNPAGHLRRFVDTGDGGHAETMVTGKPVYLLLADTNGPGPGPAIYDIIGGHYVMCVEAIGWNGGTAQLQVLGLDGETWRDVKDAATGTNVSFNADASIPLMIAQGAVLRLMLSDGIQGAFANLGGF